MAGKYRKKSVKLLQVTSVDEPPEVNVQSTVQQVGARCCNNHLSHSATVILPNVVELQWAPPLVSNGNIVFYTLYGTPLTLYEDMKGLPVSMASANIQKACVLMVNRGII